MYPYVSHPSASKNRRRRQTDLSHNFDDTTARHWDERRLRIKATTGKDRKSREFIGNIVCDGYSIIDIGCGTAVELCNIATKIQRGFLVGIEKSSDMCQQAYAKLNAVCKPKGLQFLIINCEAERIPLEGGLFDLVICENVIQHIEDPAALFNEASRLMKAGGTLVISTIGKGYQVGLPNWNARSGLGIRRFSIRELVNYGTTGNSLSLIAKDKAPVRHEFLTIYDFLKFENGIVEASKVTGCDHKQIENLIEAFSGIFRVNQPVIVDCEYVTVLFKKQGKSHSTKRLADRPICRHHFREMKFVPSDNQGDGLFYCSACLQEGWIREAYYLLYENVIYAISYSQLKRTKQKKLREILSQTSLQLNGSQSL